MGGFTSIKIIVDDDDNDDDTSEICGWVLSFRIRPKINSLTFKPAATSAPLRALTVARLKTGAEEENIAQAFCTTNVAISEIPKS